MQCELCGNEAPFLKRVIIEKVDMRVCPKCSSLGTPATPEARRSAGVTGGVEEGLERRAARMRRRDVYDEMDEKELLPGWGKTLKDAMHDKSFSREDLASRIGQPVAAVAKFEKEEMRPSDIIVAKMEKELGVELRESVGKVHTSGGKGSVGLTLGDILKQAMKK